MTPELLALARPALTADVAPCGCIKSDDHYLPCATCRAEMDADLAELYGADREYDAAYLRREEFASRRIAADRAGDANAF